MGNNFDGKVLHWKKSTEDLLGARVLCKEVMSKQIPVFGIDDMELEVWCDLTQESIQSYELYSSSAHCYLTEVVKSCETGDVDMANISDGTMQAVLAILEDREAPQFR